jgi:hypothetical protein
MPAQTRLPQYRLSFYTLTTLLLLALSLAGCQMDPNEAFIQGQWYDNNDHLSNIPAESAQESFWSFDNKTFEVYGCCFVPMSFSGYYRVLKNEGDSLLLELYHLQGENGGMVYDTADTMPLRIKIDRQADSIMIGSSDWFTRTGTVP